MRNFFVINGIAVLNEKRGTDKNCRKLKIIINENYKIIYDDDFQSDRYL